MIQLVKMESGEMVAKKIVVATVQAAIKNSEPVTALLAKQARGVPNLVLKGTLELTAYRNAQTANTGHLVTLLLVNVFVNLITPVGFVHHRVRKTLTGQSAKGNVLAKIMEIVIL